MNQDLIFYLYAQKILLESLDADGTIDINRARTKITRMIIPKRLFPALFKEMEEMGMIERVNRYRLGISNKKMCAKLDDVNLLYKNKGVF